MRISTSQMQFSAVNALLDQQTKISKTQLQLASGRRILKPSDDPVASANVLGLTQSKEITERYQLNADAARARLSIEESALIGVNNDLIRVRELALQGNNDTLTDADRRAVAANTLGRDRVVARTGCRGHPHGCPDLALGVGPHRRQNDRVASQHQSYVAERLESVGDDDDGRAGAGTRDR